MVPLEPPALPAWALPGAVSAPAAPAAPTPPPEETGEEPPDRSAPPPRTVAKTKEQKAADIVAAAPRVSGSALRLAAPPAKAPAAPLLGAAWRKTTVPVFIKKYAGKTLGDMKDVDLAWWARNYEPRPYKGNVKSSDVLFKRDSTAGLAELEADRSQRTAGGRTAGRSG